MGAKRGDVYTGIDGGGGDEMTGIREEGYWMKAPAHLSHLSYDVERSDPVFIPDTMTTIELQQLHLC